MVRRTKKKLEPYQRAWSGWNYKLNALGWAEAQIAAKKMNRGEAFSEIAREFGLKEESSSVYDSPSDTEIFGQTQGRERLRQGMADGSYFCELQRRSRVVRSQRNTPATTQIYSTTFGGRTG